ncbi:CaiB/BaiF CoA transferase family protein [Cryptosporangium arvum]|uniref:CaiB/BaiF CoA transferase family protein n=1 Tax=Cryptosporangium arvum TaxID=80871 RepID=UPI0004BA8504|nr:CoA transferase [Cryptosporangium arvum]
MMPLSGIRVLALEQMQAVPFATQLLARLGADVVKVEPLTGESGRAAQPAMVDGSGRRAGATFLRYGSGKRSLAVDLKDPRGRDLVRGLAGSFDVVAENLGPGRADRLGLGYDAVRHPRLIYLSVTGFGKDSPYERWPAYASVAEAMCGAYEYARRPNQPPVLNPMGGLGDTGAGLFGVIGVLAALRHRELTGRGQLVDVAMLDAMLSISDIVTNFWSMGLRREPDVETRVPYLLTSFHCHDGWCVLQVSRPHQFERLARLLGRPEWIGDERFADGWGWHDRWADTIRPAVEDWAAPYGMRDAAERLAGAGLVAAPCYRPGDVVTDPHVRARNMLVEIARPDGVDQPVLVAGNPIRMSGVQAPEEARPPYLGEHTSEVLGLDAATLASLRADGVIA